eukprot:9864993-Lingulodinium_polyedra.AAC.1
MCIRDRLAPARSVSPSPFGSSSACRRTPSAAQAVRTWSRFMAADGESPDGQQLWATQTAQPDQT